MHTVYNSSFIVLIERIKNHCAEGGILSPCNFNSSQRTEAEGIDQLPNISFLNIEIEEDTFPALGDANTTPLISVFDVRFLLSFNKDYSIYSSDGESMLGLMDWIPRFKDSIEIDESGLLDTHLKQTLIEPLLVSVESTEMQEISWTIEFSVKLKLRPFNRGTRRISEVITGDPLPGTLPLVLV